MLNKFCRHIYVKAYVRFNGDSNTDFDFQEPPLCIDQWRQFRFKVGGGSAKPGWGVRGHASERKLIRNGMPMLHFQEF